MTGTVDWALLRSFAAVMREGSLSGAARVLGITQPSVSRHVDALEAAVGARLFVRTRSGLSPTDRGTALLPYAEAMEAQAAALLRAAGGGKAAGDGSDGAGGTVVGTVRVSASEVVGACHLPTILQRLRVRHPRLSVELVLSNAVEDLRGRRADVAVRMVRPQGSGLVARRMGAVEVGLFARRDYLQRRGRPGAMGALREHELIGPDRDEFSAREMLARLPGVDRNGFALRVDSQLGQLAAIRAGFGIGVCQVAVAREDPALERVLEREFGVSLPLWVVMHEDLRGEARCRATFDALVEGLKRFRTGTAAAGQAGAAGPEVGVGGVGPCRPRILAREGEGDGSATGTVPFRARNGS